MHLSLFRNLKSGTFQEPSHLPLTSADMDRVACIVLGGGRGTRLFPLTTKRCKPAVCFGGRHRLIDIPVSNALNSGIKKIFIITQFLSSSIHRHLFQTYQMGPFNNGFIDVLSAEQKPTQHTWYQGTADAVRQNLSYLMETPADYFLILSGDQIYNFDFTQFVSFAQETNADMVISALPIEPKQARRMGILSKNQHHFVTDFCEKPQEEDLLQKFAINESAKPYLASMGIYLFKRDVIRRILEDDPREDFGQHLIPTLVSKGNVAAYIHKGYWEDIGTIESFYKANLALTLPHGSVNFYDENNPIYTCRYHLPSPKVEGGMVNHSILCEGVKFRGEELSYSILGPRTIVGKGTIIREAYLMGSDYYTSPISTDNEAQTIQIGRNCLIKKAILDKNVTLGDSVKLTNKKNLSSYDGDGVYIRDGIIVITKGTTLPDNFEL